MKYNTPNPPRKFPIINSKSHIINYKRRINPTNKFMTPKRQSKYSQIGPSQTKSLALNQQSIYNTIGPGMDYESHPEYSKYSLFPSK